MTDANPTFAAVFADQWDRLPPAMKLHYANRPFSNDRVTVAGTLTIEMGAMMRLLAPLMAALGLFTPRDGKDIPCTVHFLSEPGSNAFIFERWFHFPGRAPYKFRSRLVPQENREVIEYMASGVGWRCVYEYDTDTVRLLHRGYVWRLFGRDIPLSGLGTFLMGRGDALEQATGAASFRMRMTLSGGLFGRAMAYSYAGDFTVSEMALNDMVLTDA